MHITFYHYFYYRSHFLCKNITIFFNNHYRLTITSASFFLFEATTQNIGHTLEQTPIRSPIG